MIRILQRPKSPDAVTELPVEEVALFHPLAQQYPFPRGRQARAGMGSIGMRFLSDVQQSKVGSVQMLLRKGQVNPNMNYLGVYPLNLCLEQGDIDMAAVLLTAGADPLIKSDPLNRPDKKITNSMEFAEMIAKDKKHKYAMEAKVMLEMFNNEEKLKQRFAAVQVRLEKELERDTELAKRVAVGFMGFAALGYAYLHYFGWPF